MARAAPVLLYHFHVRLFSRVFSILLCLSLTHSLPPSPCSLPHSLSSSLSVRPQSSLLNMLSTPFIFTPATGNTLMLPSPLPSPAQAAPQTACGARAVVTAAVVTAVTSLADAVRIRSVTRPINAVSICPTPSCVCCYYDGVLAHTHRIRWQF